MASHDLQEPLRKIEAFGELLLARSSNLENRQRDQIERMRRAAIRMRGMVEGLLNLSRLTTQAHPFEQVNLSQVASEVLSDLEMQIQRTGARIEVGNLPAVEADPMQMHQLLQNLITNALKFHRKGVAPVVKINASDQRPGTSIKPRGDHQQSLVTSPQSPVIILIEDNGIGFDEQYTARMFQPFQRLVDQREYEGSGMGLAICRKIVLRHGGKITARNQPGGGAVFAVTLPVRQNRQV